MPVEETAGSTSIGLAIRTVVGGQRRPALVGAAALSVAIAGLRIAWPLPVAVVIDNLILATNPDQQANGMGFLWFIVTPALALVLFLFATLASEQLVGLVNRGSVEAASRRQARVFEKSRWAELVGHETRRVADQLTRTMSDINKIREIAEGLWLNIVVSAVTIAGATLVFVSLDWRLFVLAAVAATAPLVFGCRPNGAGSQADHVGWQQTTTRAAALAVVLIAGVLRTRSGLLTPGELFLSLIYLDLTGVSIARIRDQTPRLRAAASASIRLRALETMPRKPLPPGRPAPPLSGDVIFEDLSLVTVEAATSIAGLSGRIPRGARAVATGATEATLTAFLDMLHRTTSPTSGRIIVDGLDSSNLRLDTYRAQIAFVAAESTLFRGTVRDNILYGRPDASESSLRDAADRAMLGETIDELPAGYTTVIDEQGGPLSRSEAKLVMLARAALDGAPILLIDQPLSGLDATARRTMMSAISNVAAGRTTVIASSCGGNQLGADIELRLESNAVVTEPSP